MRNKVAVVYGAGGAIGGAVARAFASAGASVFLAGRTSAHVEMVAEDIVVAGGSAEAAEVDALDERAVDEHLDSVIDRAGRIDLSFNAIGIPSPKIRAPLVEIDVEQFCLPIATYTTSYFLTARAAVEALTRGLSAELAPHGVRVVGLRPQAIPETARIRDGFESYAEASGTTWDRFHDSLASRTHTRRLSTLVELANVAVFMASDEASGMTGTTVNLAMGSLDA